MYQVPYSYPPFRIGNIDVDLELFVSQITAELRHLLWRYRYRLYRTDHHRTGTDNYRYSNGQRFRVYWLYWGDK